MFGRAALLAAVLAVCGTQAAALPVRVVLDWPSGAPASARARIHAIRTAGPTVSAVPVEAEAGRDGVVLDVGDGVWHVNAVAPGYWSQGAEVAVDRQATAGVRLALWPAASLRGAIATAGGEPLPRDLEVQLSAVPAPGAETAARARPASGPSRAELRCRIDEETWSCPGPAGLFDVQLEAAGFAPRYAWDVSLEAAVNTDLGPTVLRRAASVFGRAVWKDGSDPRGACHATLRADPTRRGSLPPDDAGASLSAPLARRGYFQVVGVPPGAHLLSVECEAASAVRELNVPANGETRIDPPLRLEELPLDIVVSPTVGPEDRPWRITLDATAPRWQRIVDKVAIPANGRLSRRGLTAGTYRVDLESADGTRWLQRFFELGEGSGPLSLRVGFVGVSGRVQLGARPLRARLVFLNEGGGEPATLASDDDGQFRGLLPVAPDVEEARWTVEVHADRPPTNRRLEGVSVRSTPGEASAWLELALPIVAVRGTVVSEAGDLQSGAQVTFEDEGGGARTVVSTDDAGRFELLELPPGTYTAVAESVGAVSERTPLEVAEGVESELQLVVRSERVVFHLVSAQGPVSNAAVQVWIPPGVPRGFAGTDAQGRFEVDLPAGTTDVGLTIGAPGHALKLTRLGVSNEQTIPLDTSGGTLVLDLRQPTRAADAAPTPYLVHDGAIEAAGALAGWSTSGAGAGEDGPTVVESIEPGAYALCLAGPEEVAALWRGALPPGRCRTGSVEPGQTLTLSLP